jgi:hypothetical protein
MFDTKLQLIYKQLPLLKDDKADDFQQKMHYEMQLITFMTTVHEEARLHLAGEAKATLPEKTLHLLQHQTE